MTVSTAHVGNMDDAKTTNSSAAQRAAEAAFPEGEFAQRATVLAFREAFARGWEARATFVPGVTDAIVDDEVRRLAPVRAIQAIKRVRILNNPMGLAEAKRVVDAIREEAERIAVHTDDAQEHVRGR